MNLNRKHLPNIGWVLIATVLVALGSSNAMAANRIFDLYLKNVNSVPVTFELLKEGGHCYEGYPHLGEKFSNVPPGESVKITLARVQGHGCDGEGGYFWIKFSPAAGHRENAYFTMSNDGYLWMNKDGTNAYPGSLSEKNPSDGSYTYETVAGVAVTSVGKSIGKWVHLCSNICDEEIEVEITNRKDNAREDSTEITNAVSAGFEAGVEFPGGASKVTMNASHEKAVGTLMTEAVSTSKREATRRKVVFSAEQMQKFNIHSVWQWTATTKLSNGEQVFVKLNMYTCTPNGRKPTYWPASDEDVHTCNGANVN